MAETDIQVACQHITTFYGGGANQAESMKWLDEFSKSINAWTICDRILGERTNKLACCFAAQTIRQKVLKSLKELPNNTYLSLRDSLINHLSHIHYTQGDHLTESLLNQLCLAIADLYIQVPEWNNWIVELLNMFTSLEGDRTRMMLTLLKVFPEEIREIRVGENRRKAIQEELATSASGVLNYLTQVLHRCQTEEDVVKRVLLCVAAYLNNPAMSTDQLATSTLIQAAFQIVSLPTVSSSMHDAATECIVSATYIAENQTAHFALATTLQSHIFVLVEPFNIAVANDDMDKLANFARIFIELNESLLEKIVNDASPNPTDLGSLKCLELLLLLAGYHDYSIAERTFNIWYRISEALFMIDDDSHVAKFKPYVTRYLTALYRHARYDTDEEGILDANNDFIGFREKVTETVKDVVYIIGTDDCVRSMYQLLITCSSSNGTWDEMEAALFIISAVVHNLIPDEESVVPELAKAMANLPPTSHPALLATSIDLLGGCDEWLQKHPSYHDLVLKWLLSLIANPLFSTHCADSIEKIVAKSSESLTQYIQPMLDVIGVLERSQTRGRQIERAIIGLLRSITTLSMHLSESEIHTRLSQMCAPIVTRLQSIADARSVSVPVNNENESGGDSWIRIADEPTLWIDRIAAIFKEAKWQRQAPGGGPAPAPWVDIANALYGVLSATMSKNESKARLVEHACRSIRYLVRSLGIQSQGFVEPVVGQMIDIYSRHQHSCFLYLASILVDEYGALPSTQPGLMHMLETLAAGTFQFLSQGEDIRLKMRDNPDTLDDLFRLAGRFILRAPSAFFVHSISHSLFDCGVTALAIDHQQANRSVTKFFVDIVLQLNSAKKTNYRDDGVIAAEHLLRTRGAALVSATLNSALFSVTGGLRRDMAEIISELGRYENSYLRSWLENACSQLPRGGLAATDVQLQQFVRNITESPAKMGIRETFEQIRDLVQLYN